MASDRLLLAFYTALFLSHQGFSLLMHPPGRPTPVARPTFLIPQVPMPASTKAKPTAGPDLPEDVAEVLNDALDSRHKSAESYAQDVKEAFQVLPKENIEAAAAVLHDMANEAMKNQRYDEAAEHYTSVLAAHPHDHEVLANRSLAYLHLKRGPEALNDAALCVNLKPNWAKGYYRMGCALEECKAYKESASVFAKVVEMEPENAEASGRLMKARQMLEMVMNVERVNDPLWMHKPPPPKSEVQQRAEEAQEKSTAAVTAVWEEMGALRPLRAPSLPPRRPRRTPPPLSHARQASVRLTSS